MNKFKNNGMFDKKYLRLYAITDRTWVGEGTLLEQVNAAIKGGITMLQWREKNIIKNGIIDDALFKEAVEIRELCRANNIPFIVNDSVEMALKLEADGVHVGQSDMDAVKARQILGKNSIIGVTAKTVEQATAAYKAGADYLGSGAVFGSSTKTDAVAMKKELLTEICESMPLPVVAIGGINAENVAGLNDTKISGVAVISGIFGQKDICEATQNIFQILIDRKILI
ncbi:MAG: thiamine phosphate synthase [Lachnospiraceae bacterium]|nr:thiamine phosphate synthase [Lachnospiraceae bacterium]